MNNNELVSVIIPCYKINLEWLKNAIESVKMQTYTNCEIIICSDHPSLNEEIGIKLFINDKSKITYCVNFGQKGISATRNFAVDKAKGKWLVWLDADDELDEKCIELMLVKAHRERSNYVLGTCNLVNKKCSLKNSKIYLELYEKFKDTIYDPFFLNVTSIQPQMILRETFIKLGKFDESYLSAELTEFFLRYISFFGTSKLSLSEKAIYNYNRNMSHSHSQNRELLFEYRKKALCSYGKRQEILVDDIVYLGRNKKDGMQIYLPIINDKLAIPPYLTKIISINYDESE